MDRISSDMRSFLFIYVYLGKLTCFVDNVMMIL